MKVKTSEIQGRALDWAVAYCEGMKNIEFDGIVWSFTIDGKIKVLSSGWAAMSWCPSSDWAIAGPIIERQGIAISPNGDGRWWAYCERRVQNQYGLTPLIAAMRCYVASKLGDEVDVPEELA